MESFVSSFRKKKGERDKRGGKEAEGKRKRTPLENKIGQGRGITVSPALKKKNYTFERPKAPPDSITLKSNSSPQMNKEEKKKNAMIPLMTVITSPSTTSRVPMIGVNKACAVVTISTALMMALAGSHLVMPTESTKSTVLLGI